MLDLFEYYITIPSFLNTKCSIKSVQQSLFGKLGLYIISEKIEI